MNRSSAFRFAPALRVAVVLFATLLTRSSWAEWPSLPQVFDAARVRSLDVREAVGDVGVARGAQVGARESSLQNPYLEIIADRGRFTEDVQVQAQLFLPVELGGQRGARMEEADALLAWRLRGRDQAEARVVGASLAAYGDALVARAREILATRALELAREEANYSAARLEVGDTTAADRSLAEAEVARWSQGKSEASLALVEARVNLEALLGGEHYDDPPPDATPDPPKLRVTSPEVFTHKVLTAAPVLRALTAEAQFWDAQRERAERDKSPPLSLVLAGGRGDLGEARLGGGLAWSFPILRRNRGEIAKAAAEGDRARDVLGISRRIYETRASHLVESYRLIVDAIQKLDADGIPAAERVVDATIAGVKAGKVDLLRVYIARRDLAAARTRRLDLVATAFHLYGTMAALTGELP